MEHGLAIEVIPEDRQVTLVLTGEMDEASIGALRACLASLDSHWRSVVLDLAGVRFIDTSGIALLLQAHQDLGLDFRLLELRHVHEDVQRVLELTGTTEFIPGHATPVPTALTDTGSAID